LNMRNEKLSQADPLMILLETFKDITGLGRELTRIEIVPYETLKNSQGRSLEGSVEGNTVFLTKLESRLLMRTLLTHEYIDKLIVKHVAEPNEVVINGLLGIIEDLLYRQKEIPVEGLTKMLQPQSLRKLQMLFKDEEKPMVKVLTSHYFKDYDVTVADIKNDDKRFTSFKPLRILTAKRLREGDVVPLSEFNVLPWTEAYDTRIAPKKNLRRIYVPVAKRAGFPRMKIAITEECKGVLTKGFDVSLSYPGVVRMFASKRLDLERAKGTIRKEMERLKGGIPVKEEEK